MRTTLTLDEDVAAKIKAEARRSGKSFRETVNDALRRGLVTGKSGSKRQAFHVVTRDMGDLAPGLDLDSITRALEFLEGPVHR